MSDAWGFFVKYTDQITAIVTIFGILPTIFVFARNQMILARETLLARYDAVNRSYIEYQQLCLDHPLLQTSWYLAPADGDQPAPSAREMISKALLFDILTSMFERAHITYRLAPKAIYKSQWPGWEAFIENFAARADYRAWWNDNVGDNLDRKLVKGYSQYDRAFEGFMDKKFREAEAIP